MSATLEPEPPKKEKTISATALLKAEHERLTILAEATKGDGKIMISNMAAAFNLAAAYLASLNAPERIKRFKEVTEDDET